MAMLIPIRDLNPYKRFPIVTVALIAANVVAYLVTSESLLGLSPEASFRYGAVPCDVTMNTCPAFHPDPRVDQLVDGIVASRSAYLSVFTSMFMHGDILHLGFNMLFLWVFGNNVEDRLGRFRFPLFYLAAGIAAAFAHIMFNATSNVPIVGASGAISGVLGAYAVLWPRATIISILPLGFFFTTIRTPAWVALGLWFVVQIFGSLAGLGQLGGGGVAYLAHIGGFIAGVVLIFLFGGYRRAEPVVAEDWPV
jgi:membrane associated rhomboid family serine protease